MDLSDYKILERPKIVSKMGIKSSLSNLRQVISLSYLLYKFSDNKDECIYAKEESLSGKISLKLNNDYKDAIISFLDNDLSASIESNPLLTAQIEHIMVWMSIMVKLAKVSFVKALNMASERTGGNRYTKKLSFTSNMLVLDLIISSYSQESQRAFLSSWIKNQETISELENKVKLFLSTQLRNTEFKLRDDIDKEYYFQTENLYLQSKSGDFDFEDSHEFVGPTRILKSYLSEKMDPWLSISKSKISLSGQKNDIISFDNYLSMFSNSLDLDNVETVAKSAPQNDTISNEQVIELDYTNMKNYIDALKTKPFLLLAGISGTGKSRKVKELAYMTCPEGELRKDATSPGNYCLIEVKPNWHDSTELLGYYSNLSGKYNITPFIHFAYKAIKNPDVPFFVCLDEMNLAPVEQYFAEYLSVLETRTMQDGKIVSAELLNKSIFDCCKLDEEKGYSDAESEVLEYLKENGLRLPENLFVIGTVNMDDTTHQFSRKVIDRAFTIEMNGDTLSSMFDEDNANMLRYAENPLQLDCLKPKYVTALEALGDEKISHVAGVIKAKVPELLGKINETLKSTPFRVSFRVQNELILYLSTLILNSEQEVNKESVESFIKTATLVILLEKILPRVQGDSNLLGSSLDDLTQEVETNYSELSDSDVYKEIIAKLDEMRTRLKDSYFTNFF